MLFIFDFDSTLSDTRRFATDLFSLIAEHGIEPKIIKNTADTVAPEGFGYNLEDHFEALAPHFRDQETKSAAINKARALTNRGEQYVFPQANELLRALKTRGDELYLLSRGEHRFQTKKIDSSGLKDYFTDIVIVRDTKLHAIKKILNGKSDAANINDNPNEVRETIAAFPQIRNIIFGRKIDEFADNSIEKTRDISELAKLLKIDLSD